MLICSLASVWNSSTSRFGSSGPILHRQRWIISLFENYLIFFFLLRKLFDFYHFVLHLPNANWERRIVHFQNGPDLWLWSLPKYATCEGPSFLDPSLNLQVFYYKVGAYVFESMWSVRMRFPFCFPVNCLYYVHSLGSFLLVWLTLTLWTWSHCQVAMRYHCIYWLPENITSSKNGRRGVRCFKIHW